MKQPKKVRRRVPKRALTNHGKSRASPGQVSASFGLQGKSTKQAGRIKRNMSATGALTKGAPSGDPDTILFLGAKTHRFSCPGWCSMEQKADMHGTTDYPKSLLHGGSERQETPLAQPLRADLRHQHRRPKHESCRIS